MGYHWLPFLNRVRKILKSHFFLSWNLEFFLDSFQNIAHILGQIKCGHLWNGVGRGGCGNCIADLFPICFLKIFFFKNIKHFCILSLDGWGRLTRIPTSWISNYFREQKTNNFILSKNKMHFISSPPGWADGQDRNLIFFNSHIMNIKFFPRTKKTNFEKPH